MARDHAVLRLAVDLSILTVRDGRLHVLVVKRGNEPFVGHLALPGGFLRPDEEPLAAAVRELGEETSLDGLRLHLEQLPIFGAPDRDPRGRVVSVPYLAIAPDLPVPTAGSDATSAHWSPVASILDDATLAFDHCDILDLAVERARASLETTTVAAMFCGEQFTMGELRGVYEAVWGVALDPRNFSRKVTKTQGFVEPVGSRRTDGVGRPAALYRRGPIRRLNPAMLRSSMDS
ncbi:NUDIX hydrolase [Asanoa ishikariensis]|uniref:8-oxo-dGTP diphosphatase n=1 Tax=Asanoa ishikariensis TaxID=137265 RepID=A0A1H3T8B6_9ACTN|nr:NUDIX domain-containing protein [Asanoa ishikariensis]GIF62965.1 NUDIX hydrolase [Asanoa ishikariensis]SDZ45589.1 8-oxo-dGTP diphosphatase [Asanoa ishikariensis]